MSKQNNDNNISLSKGVGKSVDEEVFLAAVWAELIQLEPSVDYSSLIEVADSLSPAYITHPNSRQYLVEKVLSLHYNEEFEFPFDSPPQRYVSVSHTLIAMPCIFTPTMVIPVLIGDAPAEKSQSSGPHRDSGQAHLAIGSLHPISLQHEAASAQDLVFNHPSQQLLPDGWWRGVSGPIPFSQTSFGVKSVHGQRLDKGVSLKYQVEILYESRLGRRGKTFFTLTPEQEVSGLGGKDQSGRRDRQRGGLISLVGNRSEFATGFSSQQPQKQVIGTGVYTIICAGPIGAGQHRDVKKVFFGYNLINWARPPPPFDGWSSSDVAILAQSELSKAGCCFRLIDHIAPLPTDPRTMRHLAKFVTSTMVRNIGKVLGAPGFGYARLNIEGSDLVSRIERIAKMSGPLLFADCEGPKDNQKWGLCSLKLRSGVASFTITTAPDPSAFANQIVLSKDPTRERAFTDTSLGIEYINIDDLVPWREERPHSPIGGVLQMCVRIYALLHSVPHLEYEDSNIRRLYRLSREGVIRTVSGQMGMTDVISVLIMSVNS